MESQEENPSANSSKDLNPSTRSIGGLDGLLFCISDVRHGVGPLLSIHLRNALQWDPAKIGMTLATVEFSAFLSQIPAGLLVDASRWKRAIIATACGLIILGSFIILCLSSFKAIIIAQLLMGISIALLTPALSSITLGLFGRKKFASRIGKNEVLNHCGNVFSALTAGVASYLLGSQWIFILLIGFAIGSLLSLLFIKPKEIDYAVARELAQNENNNEPISVAKLLKRNSIIIFNISLVLYYMANGAQMSLVGQILANKDSAHSPLYIAGCMIIAEIAMIGTAFTMSCIVNHYNRKSLFLTAFTILPIRAVLYTLADNPFFLLMIQILDGIAAGILGVIGIVIIADLAIDTGRFNFLQGIGGMAVGLGESMSQLFAGFVAKFFGFNMSFFFLASVALVGILFFTFFMPETKPRRLKT